MLSRALLLASSVAALASTAVNAEYTISSFTTTSFGYTLQLATADGNTDYPSLSADVIAAQTNMVRIRIQPTAASPGPAPYIIPDEVFPQSSKASSTYAPPATVPYEAYIDHSSGVPTFVLSFNNKAVFSTDFKDLAFEKQKVTMAYKYPSQSYVSGYMERNYDYFLGTDGQPVTLSLWNTDNGTPWKNPMYGNYPIFWFNNPLTSTHVAVLNMNAHAQQATVNPADSTITLINIGGILDLHVFMPGAKNNALEVVKAYQQYVGPAAVPPYWSLGTHQCRWGYHNLTELKAVPEGYKKAGIPLEVLWNDIDYMDSFKVFTIDQERYAGLPEYVAQIQSEGLKYIQIVDPGVATQLNYSVFEDGEAADIFMKLDNKTMVGVVWPGWTAFPDFTSDAGRQFWVDQVVKYFKTIKLDGMWTDMNEIASFCGGACPIAPGTPWEQDWQTVDWNTFQTAICDKNNCTAQNTTLNYPPFNPLTNGNQLFTKTPDMEAMTSVGKYYDMKMFYCNLENIATHKALLTANPATRPFILTRSAFVGAGRSTFHWLGDNNAHFNAVDGGMVSSINGNMASNLGGIFMVGADIPGFAGPATTEELADRWYQLGSYYTFMRNHRTLGSPDTYQEPYLFSETAQKSFIQAIHRRYRLLPYLFSSLMAGTLYGVPVTMHPSVVFSDQPSLYNESHAFMIGESLYVVPAVLQGSNAATARIPAGLWYTLSDEAATPYSTLAANGETVLFDVPLYTAIPALQRAGTMIPFHNSAKMLVNDTKATGYSLVFALGMDGTARGQLIVDSNDAPITDTNVFVMDYTATGSVTAGFVTGSVSSKASPTDVDLTNGANVVIMFPQGSNIEVSSLTATVNGQAVEAVVPVAGKYQFKFNGVSSLSAFSLQWAANATIVPANPSVGGDGENWKTAFIISISILGGAVVVALAVLGFVMQRRASQYDEGETLPLNSERY